MTLPPDLLLRMPEEAVRRIALDILDEAHAASDRLDDPSDIEALHDFRVAVRRLRSTFRAWKSQLDGSVKKRHRNALKDLQSSTGAGRDAEVAVQWLRTQEKGMTPSHRRGLRWMVDRLEGRHSSAMGQVCVGVRDRFLRVEQGLRDAIEVMQVEVHLSRPHAADTFAAALARAVREHAQDLVLHLVRISSLQDEDEAHEARIAGKRMRYLVEPIRPYLPEAVALVKRMKRLQDILGDLNDCFVMRADLGKALEEAAIEHARRLHELMGNEDPEEVRHEIRRSHRPGLLEISRRVQQRRNGLFETLLGGWLEDGAHDVLEDAERLASKLEHLARGDVEIERKYLLRALPELPEGVASVEIDQGWLPGDRLRERLRRRVSATDTKYFRTVKLGEGIQRTELEEETTESVYAALWPLTEGCRVQKRRYLVPDGGLTWEIDEFLDRELFLAEVELSDPKEDVIVPEWLVPVLKRDVTGTRKYVNLNLAR